jgi:hypothetical protein
MSWRYTNLTNLFTTAQPQRIQRDMLSMLTAPVILHTELSTTTCMSFGGTPMAGITRISQ